MKMAFLSYSRKDKQTAITLRDDLAFRGISVWMDLQDIPLGAAWASEIEAAITDCECFLLLMTPASLESEYVKYEYEFAMKRQKKIIPLLLASCDIPPALQPIQYLDLRDYRAQLPSLIKIFPMQAQTQEDTSVRLRDNLLSASTDVRRLALILIGRKRYYELTEAVIQRLDDDDSEVRATAAWALDQLGKTQAIPALIKAIHDPSFDVRSNAGWALVHLGTAALDPVQTILRETKNPAAREMAQLILDHLVR